MSDLSVIDGLGFGLPVSCLRHSACVRWAHCVGWQWRVDGVHLIAALELVISIKKSTQIDLSPAW